MRYEEAKKQWGVDGMPADKQRLAKAMYEAGQRDMRERAAGICVEPSRLFMGELEHDGACEAVQNIQDRIRAIKLEG